MKLLFKKSAGLMILTLLSFSLLSFSDPDLKHRRIKKGQKKECRKQSGSCMVQKQKSYKTPFKYNSVNIKSKDTGR